MIQTARGVHVRSVEIALVRTAMHLGKMACHYSQRAALRSPAHGNLRRLDPRPSHSSTQSEGAHEQRAPMDHGRNAPVHGGGAIGMARLIARRATYVYATGHPTIRRAARYCTTQHSYYPCR